MAKFGTNKSSSSKFGTKQSGQAKKAPLETSKGLIDVALKNNLQPAVERIKNLLAGESPKKIFSGGRFEDVMDALSVGQYSTAGAAKGLVTGKGAVKGAVEGVRQRASFMDPELLGQFGSFGKVGGFAADIFIDPLNLASGIPVAGKLGKLAKIGQTAERAVRTAKDTGTLGEAAFGAVKLGVEKLGNIKAIPTSGGLTSANKLLVYMHGVDPVYRKAFEGTERAIAQGEEKLIGLSKAISQLSQQEQQMVAVARKAGQLNTLPPKLYEKSRPAFDMLDQLSTEAVRLGILPQDAAANVGTYFKRAYRSKDLPDAIEILPFKGKKPTRLDLREFKQRKDIPEEIRTAMGEILEAGYPTAKALLQLTRAVGRTKFFNDIAKTFATDQPLEGFTQLTKTKNLGALSEQFVPDAIAEHLNEMVKPRTNLQKAGEYLTGKFKFSKVVLNPAVHVRNIVSNLVLNSFEGLSPLTPEGGKAYAQAARSLFKKDDLYKEAQQFGLNVDNFAATEIKDMLISEAKANKIPGLKQVNELGEFLSKAYGKEEEFGKMAQYLYQKSKGLSPEEAANVARRATFDYSQVTPMIRNLRTNLFGAPFVTFTYKSTPQVVRTALTKPGRISAYGKAKRGVESLSDQQELESERAVEPQWMKNGFFVKLPMKDKYGRSAYFDLTYIMPFGDLVAGSLADRRIDRNTGLPQGIVDTIAQISPAGDLLASLKSNQDFFGNQIFKPSDTAQKQLLDIAKFLGKQVSPPLAEGLFAPAGERGLGRFGTAEKFEREAAEGKIDDVSARQTRTTGQELLRTFGAKVQPISQTAQAEQREKELRKAIETLLQDQGMLKKFQRSFIPKE